MFTAKNITHCPILNYTIVQGADDKPLGDNLIQLITLNKTFLRVDQRTPTFTKFKIKA